jgi:hypothetical protein
MPGEASATEKARAAAAVSLQGWLVKKAVRTVAKLDWKRRFFVLSNCSLTHHSQPGARAKHSLQIDFRTRARICNVRAHGVTSELEVFFATTGAVLYAVADEGASDDALSKWVEAVNQIAELLQPPESLAARAAAEEIARERARVAAEAAARDDEARKERLAEVRAAEAAYQAQRPLRAAVAQRRPRRRRRRRRRRQRRAPREFSSTFCTRGARTTSASSASARPWPRA